MKTNKSIRPSEKCLEAVKNFPTPTDITGVRSWFGLINQVAYAHSLTSDLAPFTSLLKPKNEFYWDDSLQTIFDRSKKAIVSKVKSGVQIFDPLRKTCLITDWSKTGSGFLLTQKHCQCPIIRPNCCPTGWKLVFAGSKFNNKAESQYAPVEGECLAVVRALTKAKYYVFQNSLSCWDLGIIGL